MTGSYYNDNWTEKVTVPIKKVAGKWEFFYGGEVPVRDGAMADITLNTQDINDERFKARVTKELRVRVLDEGTRLLVALSDHACRMSEQLRKFAYGPPPGATRAVEIRLGPLKQKNKEKQMEIHEVVESGGLWLKVKGLERCELQASTVLMPDGLGVKTAVSLNHAFTLLSEKYETHRLSHTGNVYERIFYREHNDRWYPLNDLRQGVLAQAEQTLLTQTWAEVERQLGWRPTPVGKPGKR